MHSNQFCRACGTDLRIARTTLEKPDSITASATSARDEIGRAISAKIQQSNLHELGKLTEDVLPEIEKFLESPEEKKMRRVRNGTIVSFVGLGAMIGFTLAAMFVDDDLFFFAALGTITFFIGLNLMVNGWFFTVPKKSIEENSTDADTQRKLDSLNTNELLMPPTARQEFSSVTEHTTKHLKKDAED